MKIKHFQGYGSVQANKIPDNSCTLHVRVKGNHECGLRRDDGYDLFHWLISRFDKNEKDYIQWKNKMPKIKIFEGSENGEETCDYLFIY